MISRRTLNRHGLAALSVLLMPALTTAPSRAYHSASEPSDGTVKSFIAVDPPRAVTPFPFADAAGNTTSLADFADRLVLVNLWATWCPPCVREMPALDRLQGKFDKAEFMVVPLSLDRGGMAVVKRFVAQLDLRHLDMFADPEQAAGVTFPVDVLPASFLIDRAGRMTHFLRSFVDWDAPEAEAMVARLIAH